MNENSFQVDGNAIPWLKLTYFLNQAETLVKKLYFSTL